MASRNSQTSIQTEPENAWLNSQIFSPWISPEALNDLYPLHTKYWLKGSHLRFENVLERTGYVPTLLFTSFWNAVCEDLGQYKQECWQLPVKPSLIPTPAGRAFSKSTRFCISPTVTLLPLLLHFSSTSFDMQSFNSKEVFQGRSKVLMFTNLPNLFFL